MNCSKTRQRGWLDIDIIRAARFRVTRTIVEPSRNLSPFNISNDEHLRPIQPHIGVFPAQNRIRKVTCCNTNLSFIMDVRNLD